MAEASGAPIFRPERMRLTGGEQLVRGSVSVIQAVSLSCCTSLKRQALPSWQSPSGLRYPLLDTADARCGSYRRPDRAPRRSLAAHPIVQQGSGIGPPRQSMSHRPISGQFNQVATRFGVKEATANHAMTRVAAALIRKGRIRILKELGVYN